MSGIPKFGKSWLENFIPDEELQNTFLTSEVVRNVLMLQCVYLTSVYGELLRSFRTGAYREEGAQLHINMPESTRSKAINFEDAKQPAFKVGLIGCGQVGTMILTKLLEIQGQIPNLKLMVSTRQPHLLRAFQQEFGIWVDFNNERIVSECDLVFLCVLPFQA